MSRHSRLLASFVIAGGVIYLAIEVALHFLRPDYHPARRFLSEYAVGNFGFLGTIAFCVMAATNATLVAALFLEVRRSSLLLVSCGLLAVVSVGFGLLALFPTDLSNPTGGPPLIRTSTGVIHDVSASILSSALGGASLTLPFAYRLDDRWRPAFSRIIPFGVAIPLTLCVAGLVSWQWCGAGQRLVVATGLVWIFTNAALLLRPGIKRVSP